MIDDNDEEDLIITAAAERAKDPAVQKAFAQTESEFFDNLEKEIREGKRCPHCFQNLTKKLGDGPNFCDGTCMA